MAKDKIADYDASAAGNTDIGGIGIQGTNLPSNFDNAFREIMAQLKEADDGTSPLTDTWSFCDPADRTKVFRLDAGSITTATTRVLTVPNATTTIVGTDVTQTLTNKTFTDNVTSFADNGDATKLAQFDCSGITTATTRTYTLPNASSTLAVLGLAQTWTAIQTFPTGTVVSGSGFTTLHVTSTGAGSDPALALNAVGGTWSLLNDDSASNDLDLRWDNSSKWTLSTSGTLSTTRARLSDTTDATLSSTAHAFQIGSSSSSNLIADTNEIMARNNGATATLGLNLEGGQVQVGAGGLIVDAGVEVKGLTLTAGSALSVSSNTITPVTSYHTIDATGSPTVKTIATTNIADGQLLVLRKNSAAGTVTFDETGNIAVTGTTRALSAQADTITFIRGGANFFEIAYSDNA